MDTLHILVADDEREMRRAIERALQGYRLALPDVDQEVCFQLDQAASGEEALEKIAVAQPDMLLLDHKMGGMTGLDVLEQLVKQERDILTIMVTAYASLETAVTATKRGAFDFIAKPFTPTELKDTLRKATAHLITHRQAVRLAQEKKQLRFQFISVLAHELKAPLGAVESYLRILNDPSMRTNPESAHQMIERCLIRCEGMKKLVYDLLDLTRIESGQRRREIIEVNFAEVAAAAMETVRIEAAKRNIELRVDIDPALTMQGDRSELDIIFNNLITNAVKYNRDGGKVLVACSATDQEVTVAVTDTGIGLTPAEAAKLFHEFVRIKNRNTLNILGSGLGLSTIKRLAVLYGGDVSVNSEPGVGSTFTVRLQRNGAAGNHNHGSTDHPELAAAE